MLKSSLTPPYKFRLTTLAKESLLKHELTEIEFITICNEEIAAHGDKGAPEMGCFTVPRTEKMSDLEDAIADPRTTVYIMTHRTTNDLGDYLQVDLCRFEVVEMNSGPFKGKKVQMPTGMSDPEMGEAQSKILGMMKDDEL